MEVRSSIISRLSVWALVLVLTVVPNGLWADITWTGNVSPTPGASPWNVPDSTEIKIGITADGQITVDLGSVVNSAAKAYLGYGPTTTGTVTITGVGSTWANQDVMSIGAEGVGLLTVSAGGQLTTNRGMIGGYDPFEDGTPLADYFAPGADLPNGTGTATVTGNGSTWTSDEITVGMFGNGTLNVESGGQVGTYRTFVGMGPGVTGTVNVNNGTMTAEDSLAVGIWGTGEMTIQGGGQVTTADAYIGGVPLELLNSSYDADLIPDGTGTLTVTGQGSSLTVNEVGNGSGTLFVGYSGTGTLNVEAGGTVTTGALVIGGMPEADGSVNVRNLGSTLAGTWEIQVGVWADAANLTIEDHASVTAGKLQVGGLESSDIGLDQEILDDIGRAEGTGTVDVTSNATLDVSGPAYIGYSGTGTVNVNTGGQVSTYQTALGIGPGSHGTILVDGPGSKYQVTHNAEYETDKGEKTGGLVVGGYGTGTATVKNGGQMTVDNVVYVGGYHAGELPFTGTIEGQSIDHPANGTGTLTIQNHGSSLTTSAIQVGATGTGYLNVLGDAQGPAYLTTTEAGIGAASGSHGEAVVGNAGAWANSGSMFVGGYGTGTLTVQSGGHVSVGAALTIGGFKVEDFTSGLFNYGDDQPNGTGTVTVTGDGSVLTQAQLEAIGIVVGKHGTGTLQIQNGGRVDSQVGVVGAKSGGTGTVVVDGANSLWKLSGTNTNVPTDITPAGNGTVTVSNGGTIQVDGSKAVLLVGSQGTTNGGGQVTVGSQGQGTMTVANGGTVQSKKTIIGGTMNPAYESIEQVAAHASELGTGTGTVTLTGASSTWQTRDVFVGFSGNGTLNVTDGQVINETGWLGGLPNVSGTATISGATAQWTNQYNLAVGMFGQGVLNIEDGAHVTTPMASIGGMPFGFANESFNPNLIANGTGTVTVTGAGSTLDVTSSDTLYVGYSGTGTLDVKSGGTVTADTALVGFRPGVTGSVTVQDSGSTFSASGQTVVGAWGTGNLNITNGGQVTTDTLSVGGFDPTTITLAADVAGGLTNPNGTGQVTVTGTGSSLSITGQNPLTLGAGGTGTLTVSNGGQVTSPDNFVGGYLKFTPDPVSQVKNVSILSGTGTAQVTGAGSQWHTNALVVGVGGAGTLDISNGGQADSHLAAAGMGAQSTGTATVTGSGSAWTIAPGTDPETDAGHGELMVGGWGQGNLTVASGGRVDAAKMAIGGFDLATISGANTVWNFGTPTGTGTVTVTGASSGTASQLNVTGSGPLAVGYSGTGTLNVSDGGHVASGDGFLGYLTGSNGTVNVNGTDSKWNVAGNLYVGGTAEAAGGTGLLNVANGGLVDVTGDMTVWQTGTLRGNGTVTVETPTTLHNYGTIAPGSSSSIGTLTVNGNVVFEPGSTYAVKIGQSSSDKLEVNGDTTINGGTVKVSSLGTVVGEHSYQIIHADSVTVPTGGGFGAPDTALLTFAVSDSSLAYDPTSVVLHLTAANFNDPTIAQTPNQQQLGGALQDIANAGGNGVTHALQQVETPEGLRQAYNQLSGQSRPPLTPVAATGSSRFLGTVSDRMQSLQTGLMSGMSNMSVVAMSGPDSRMDGGQMYDFAAPGQSVAIGNGSNLLADSPWGLWGRGYGLFGDRETEKDAPGYSYQMYGGSLGLDYQFTEKFLGGVVVGVTDGNVDFAGMRDNADFQAIQVGLYGDLTWEKWYLNSMATYANLHYDTERFVDLTGERLTGDLSGNDWSAYVEGGKNVNLSPSALLQPFVSLQYSYLTFGSYTETGGASALSYGDQTSQSVKGSLGARLTDRLFESPGGFHADGQLRGRWIHEFGDDQSKVDTSFASNPGAVFTIHDAEIARDSALVGVGISANITKQLRASADYDALLNTDETVQLVSAALEYRW